MTRREKITVDLFAGAGGLTEGFRSVGFRTVFANEFEQPARETFQRNHPQVHTSSDDVRRLDASEVRRQLGIRRGELDVLLGGPPCQGFSTYGARDLHDHRNQLYHHFLRFLNEFRPKAFVMENVIGILSMDRGRLVEDIVTQATRQGYAVEVLTLDAVHFGVPQNRKRVFIWGASAGTRLSPPVPTNYPSPDNAREIGRQGFLFAEAADTHAGPLLTVRDAISDLPREALAPAQTHLALPYPARDGLSAYQEEMRRGSQVLLHHSAKQMLGVRRLRLALLRPGDYGTRIRRRLADEGLPGEVIDDLLSGGNGLRDMRECRTEDRRKEVALREVLQQGHVDIDAVLSSLDSGGFANKYRRLEWDAPAHTLVAHMARDCSDFVHPEVDRFITVREAARLQSFPDSYYFAGSQFRQFRHIGNAVPPRLAAALARTVAKSLGVTSSELLPTGTE